MSHPAKEPGHKPSALFCGAVGGSIYRIQTLCVILWSCRWVPPSGHKPFALFCGAVAGSSHRDTNLLRYFVELSMGPAIRYKASALFRGAVGWSIHRVQSLCVILWRCRWVQPSGTKPLPYLVDLSVPDILQQNRVQTFCFTLLTCRR